MLLGDHAQRTGPGSGFDHDRRPRTEQPRVENVPESDAVSPVDPGGSTWTPTSALHFLLRPAPGLTPPRQRLPALTISCHRSVPHARVTQHALPSTGCRRVGRAWPPGCEWILRVSA